MSAITPQAFKAVIAGILKRHALWQCETIQDFCDLSREQVMHRIESGHYRWAFNIGRGIRSKEIRVLAYCVVEESMGVFDGVGATRKLNLPEVINLVLPDRDIRSTELKRRLSCSHQLVYDNAGNFKMSRWPVAKDGPNAYTVFSRESVAAWLSGRVME